MQDTGSLGLVHWDDPEGRYGEGGGRGGSGLGTRVHQWQINVDVWQNQCNTVKLKKKKEGGMWREVGGHSGWRTRVHPWWMHVDVWQNQYNIVK